MQAFFSFPSFYDKTTFFSSPFIYTTFEREKKQSHPFSPYYDTSTLQQFHIYNSSAMHAQHDLKETERGPTCRVSGRIVVNTHSLVMEALIRLAKPCHPPSLSQHPPFIFPLSPKSPTKVQVSYSLLFRLQSPSQATYCWSMM